MARAAPSKRAGSWLWLQGMVCGALLAFATPVAVLIGGLLAPTLIAVVTDGAPGRPVARAVFLAGAAFTVAPVWHLVIGARDMATALDLLADPAVIAPAWLAGACGWALCEVLPVILRVLADLRATARAASLTAELTKIRAEWDLSQEKGP